MNKTKEILTPEERWKRGIEHNNLSEKIYYFISEYDYNHCGDRFCFKSGGDGDNGEQLMYLLDVFFDSKDGKDILEEYADWKIKECLPKRMKEEYVNLEMCDDPSFIEGKEWNACIDQILLNKDKK